MSEDPTRRANLNTIVAAAQQAISNNHSYLALATPTTAQAVAQVAALTRQVDGIIRVMLGQLDSAADT